MKNQSGRSMIEMLGVLAIIGVLSLGGVAVFNAAMNRHTANNLTYDVMLMAESTLSLGPQEQMPFDASTEYNQMSSVLVGDVANVIVNDVDKEICDILISKGENGVFVLENQADGSPLTDCADDGTDVVFAFRDGYLPEAGVCNPTCEAGHICSNGQCCPTRIPEHACSIEPTGACANVTPAAKRDGAPCGENGDGFCQNGDCVEWDCSGNWTGRNCDICDVNSLNCGDAQYIDAENCLCVCENERYTGYYCSYSCPTATEYVSGLSKSACEACGNTFWGIGTCYACGWSSAVSFFTETEADECENACAGTEYERIALTTSCYLGTKTCPSATSYKSAMPKSVCEACGNTVWDNGYCRGCGYRSVISFNTEEEAEACVSACAGSGYERTAEGRYCYRSPSTTCPSVTGRMQNMSKSVCEACDNAFWKNGNCYGCGYSGLLSFDTEAEAEACVSACAGSGYERYHNGLYCRLANTTCPSETTSTSNMTKSACEACTATDGIQRIWSNGTCYGCGYSDNISFPTEAEAEACMNMCAGSGYERYHNGLDDYCRLANTTCPSATSWTQNMSKSACEACDNAFWKNGNCYGCGYSGGISFDTEAEAEVCVSACAGSGYERTADGNYCYWSPSPTCPSETTSTSNMTKSACEACTAKDGIQRIWSKGNCYGCGYSDSISFPTESEAEACANQCAGSGYERYHNGLDEHCRLATNTTCPSLTSYTSNMTKSACEACGNTLWGEGTCYSCGYSSIIYFFREDVAEACVTACADSGYPREVDKSGDLYYCSRK